MMLLTARRMLLTTALQARRLLGARSLSASPTKRARRAQERQSESAAAMRSMGEQVRVPTVVLVGRPNVGKSTLFNRLCGRREAIVSRVAGTTRDWKEGDASISSLEFRLVDTPGLEAGGKSSEGSSVQGRMPPEARHHRGADPAGWLRASPSALGLASLEAVPAAAAHGEADAIAATAWGVRSAESDAGSGDASNALLGVPIEQRMAHQTAEAVRRADLVWFVVDGRAGITADDERVARWIRRVRGPVASATGLAYSRAVSTEGKEVEEEDQDQHQHHQRRRDLGVTVIVNKVDGLVEGAMADEWWADLQEQIDTLGLAGERDPVAVSGEHGHGLADLHELLLPHATTFDEGIANDDALTVPEATPAQPVSESQEERRARLVKEGTVTVAIVGRPNVGKSTLVNRLLGSERVLTGPMPGLTRDATVIAWEWGGRRIELVDTAGMRRAGRWDWSSSGAGLEVASVHQARRALALAQVVVLVLDAETGLTRQDASIAQRVIEEGRPLIVLLNKCDTIPDRNAARATVVEQVNSALSAARDPPVLLASALAGLGMEDLMPAVLAAHERWSTRVSTGWLNRWFARLSLHHPPPAAKRHGAKSGGTVRPLRVKYLVQTGSRPPTFVVFANRPSIPEDYSRFLVNSLRQELDLRGIPIRLQVRGPPPRTAASSVHRHPVAARVATSPAS